MKTIQGAAVAALLAGLAMAATAAQAAPAKTPVYKTAAEQFAAIKAKAKGPLQKTGPELPDWSGLWVRVPSNWDGFDPAEKPWTTTAALKPEAKVVFDKRMADLKAGHDWDRLNYCLPPGFPRDTAEPGIREFILRPDQVRIFVEVQNSIRRIYTDGSGHTPEDEAYALWEGDSIGFWDGDALVVHTSQLKEAEFAFAGPEHSDQIETVEVIRKTAPNTIQDRITVYDPMTLVRPWTVTQTYVKDRTPDLRLRNYSCAENNQVTRTPDGSVHIILPSEKGYHDPATFGSEPDRGAGK